MSEDCGGKLKFHLVEDMAGAKIKVLGIGAAAGTPSTG